MDLALPVIISNLSRVLMSLVDVAMVGTLRVEAPSRRQGGMLVWGALSLVLGIRTSVQTIASEGLVKIKQKNVSALNNGFC